MRPRWKRERERDGATNRAVPHVREKERARTKKENRGGTGATLRARQWPWTTVRERLAKQKWNDGGATNLWAAAAAETRHELMLAMATRRSPKETEVSTGLVAMRRT